MADKDGVCMAARKWCVNCTHYYTEYTCGYISANCSIVGSLDMDQHKYHPDVTANNCEHYSEKQGVLFNGVEVD